MDESRDYRYHQPTWSLDRQSRRLKDSCDMCSASKVRCDRQNPICGRCDKLAYPCFYSPARRVGRPQGRSSRQPTKARHDSATGGANLNTHHVSPQQQSAYPVTPVSPRSRQNSGGVDRHDPAACPSPLDTPPRPGPLTPPICSHQRPAESSESVSSGSGPSSSSSSSSSTSATSGASSSLALSATQTSNDSDNCESDCIELSMATQRQLETASGKVSSTVTQHAPAGPWTAEVVQAAEAALQTAGAAMRRMSTTLICPCSERLETGVIVSAACLSILDLYGVVVSCSTARPPPPTYAVTTSQQQQSPLMAIMSNSTSAGDGGSGGSKNGGLGLLWDDVLPSFSGHRDALLQCGQRKEDQLLVHILEELAKLATVVYQFTNRYRVGVRQAQPGSSEMEILKGLAAFLKYRLKAAGDETAAKLQTAPPHRGTTRPGGAAA